MLSIIIALYILKFCRSSHRRCSVRKGVLINFAKFAGKHLCQSLFFNKVAGWGDCFWICDRIDHGLYINTTSWFRMEDFLLLIWLSANFLYLDGKTVVSRCKRLRKAFDDPMLELHLSFYTATRPNFTYYRLVLQR